MAENGTIQQARRQKEVPLGRSQMDVLRRLQRAGGKLAASLLPAWMRVKIDPLTTCSNPQRVDPDSPLGRGLVDIRISRGRASYELTETGLAVLAEQA